MNSSRSSLIALVLAVFVIATTGCQHVKPDSGITNEWEEPELDRGAKARVEAQARYASGLIHELHQDPAKALEDFILSVKADPSNEDLALDVSRTLVLKKDLPQALEIAELAAAQPHASAQAFAHLAVLYAEDGRFNDAEKANRKAIKLAPEKLQGYYNLYTLHLSRDEPDKARAVLDEARAQKVDSTEYWLDLAELHANFLRSKPDQKDALQPAMKECLERATKTGLGTPLQRQRLADGYALAGETQKAVDLLLKQLEDYPDNPRIRDFARQKLLALYISTDDADGALQQLELMVKDHPTNPQANFLLASLAAEKAEEFREAARKEPEKQEELLAKAKPYWEKAAQYFRKTLQLKPDLEQAYYSLTPVLLDLERIDEAATLMIEARERYPESFVVHYFSAVIFAQKEDPAKAVEHFTRAESIAKANSPGRLDHRFYFQMGAQLERNKQYDEAADTFKRVLELEANYAPALNYLGYMWADLGTNLTEARKLIQKAVDLEPENSAYLDSLAWVLFKLDQPNLALTYMEQALEHQEEPDATLFDHLGDIQKAAGQVENARKSWQKSLEITPDPKVREKLDHSAAPEAVRP